MSYPVPRTSGKATAVVIYFGRIQGNAFFLPVYQIFADGVSPVHSAPLWSIGKTLIKQVILSLVPDKSVWIIDPAIWSFKWNGECRTLVADCIGFLFDAAGTYAVSRLFELYRKMTGGLWWLSCHSYEIMRDSCF